jgi:thioredoxin-related protein
MYAQEQVEQDKIEWMKDYKEALKVGEKDQKPIMIYFSIPGCRWCDKLEEGPFSDQGVIKESRGFICVRVDGKQDPETAKKYGVRAYPTIVFTDSAGKRLKGVKKIEGYKRAKALLAKMQKALKSFKEPQKEEKDK